MEARAENFIRQYRHVLPFLAVLSVSLFFGAAMQRVAFYICIPFLVSTLWAFRSETISFLKSRAFILIAAYLGYFTISFFWSGEGNIEEFFRVIRNSLAIFLFTASLAIALNHTNFERFFPLGLALACLGYALIVCAVRYGLEGIEFGSRLEAWGRYENPIHFSFLLSLGVLLVVAWWMAYRDNYLQGMAIVALLIFIIILSQTRTACVSLAACILAVAFFGYMRMALILTGVSLAAILAAYLSWTDLFENMIGRSDSFRLQIWGDAIEGAMQKPIWGHGVAETPEFFPEANDRKAGWESTHNAVIGHLYHGGIVGLALYLCMAAYMLFLPVKSFLAGRGKQTTVSFFTVFTFLAVIYSLAASQFNFAHFLKNVQIHWLVFWLPFSCVAAMELRQKKEKHAPAH